MCSGDGGGSYAHDEGEDYMYTCTYTVPCIICISQGYKLCAGSLCNEDYMDDHAS